MKNQLFCSAVIAMVILSGCGNASNTNSSENKPESKSPKMDHSKMNHSGSAQVPKGLKNAKNPTYKVGSQAIIKADHMKGMKGAIAKIVGAYDTIAYTITYTPTTGGEKVKNHKWIVQEDIKNVANQPLKPGTKVVLKADHMKGMKGAIAIIESGEKTTVYMVDYTPTTGGKKVKNHKWVTENEFRPINTK